MKKNYFKIKVAILFGYNGSNFYGLQKITNNPFKTIEGELEKALYACKMITDTNFDTLQKIGWSRASRTDKGVHACVNVINCKLCLDEKYLANDGEAVDGKTDFKKKIDWKKVIEEINSNIDKQLRIFGLRLVTKGFDVRKSACSRRYEYIAPLSLFKSNSDENETEVLDKIRAIASKFKGSHNFHNYTRKIKATDKSCQRYIIEISVEVFKSKDLIAGQNIPLVIFYLHGQSFLYHQIRKMIGSIAQVIRLKLDSSFINNSFLHNKVDIWLAPSEGLLLDRVT